MRQFRNPIISLGAMLALSCIAVSAPAQDSVVARLLDQRNDPAALATEDEPPQYEDFDVEQAAMWLQQPAGQPAAPSLESAARRTTRGSRQANVGLASVPNMFGDCACGVTAIITAVGPGFQNDSQFRLPTVGGARTGKIADNDIAMPVDRIFCSYSHFTDAFMMNSQQVLPPAGPLLSRQEPIDRYTLGVEKTFFNQMTSVEVRMPFSGSFNATLPGLAVDNGNFGNLAVILKGLLWRGQNLGLGAGMAIETPTGSSILSHIGTIPATHLRILNDAVHLLPYVGFLYAPGDPQWGWGNGLFVTGFLQVDTAANGNRVQFTGPNNSSPVTIGKYNEQDLMFIDLSVGYWLYRNPDAERLTGLAVVNEMHYTTSLARPDIVAGANATGAGATITNPNGHIDVTNYTIGVQALMYDLSSLRVCGVFPLGSRSDSRFFDAELQVQFNRRF